LTEGEGTPMPPYEVFFSRKAEQQIQALEHYIADAASPEVAARYIDALIEYCDGLSIFPHRGNLMDDVKPGLRITHFRKRVVIAFHIEQFRVNILGIFYGGQDYESVLMEVD